MTKPNQKVNEPLSKVKEQGQQKPAEIIDFSAVRSEIAPSGGLDLGFKLLGEMLMYFRKNRLMPILMVCRTIQTIEVKDNVAEISSEQNEINELISNESYKFEMDKFMKEHGLSFKIKEKEYKVSPVDVLNELVGGKLVIK